jgi:hypothetical protein
MRKKKSRMNRDFFFVDFYQDLTSSKSTSVASALLPD